MAALRAAGIRVSNATRHSSKVWSSSYVNGRLAGIDSWTATEVGDALVDMFVLAEAHTFVANPASSFSGCVRDIRASHGLALETTLVGVPPHDDVAFLSEVRLSLPQPLREG
eukprot:CAMPEP_0115873446 /NCGR_PEP_ID=MMETSP0287-20121206/23998_1 /TAXON_ID=412157 /ORGANISM="Chrysochromulina rotalis, Strain UIO044" /LENGTH=111 /DNA_ID=CAMNT_0003328503 /DNA_START=200 /DNA_END=535 /DNA_ORIENTATION=+